MAPSKMPYLDWQYSPLVDSYKAFKARMELYFVDNDITDAAKKAVKIKIASGDEGMRRILSSGLSQTDLCNPSELWKLFESQLDASLKINFRVHRLEFATMHQLLDETITTYVSRLREKASKCEFEKSELEDRLIESIILSTPYEDFRKELLTKPKGYSITQVIERAREYEAIKASMASLTGIKSPVNTYTINAIKKTCGNCGLQHERRACPAYRDTCSACNNKGHWKKFCRITARKSTTQNKPPHHKHKHRRQHAMDVQQSDDTPDCPDNKDRCGFFAVCISNLALKPLNNNEAFTKLNMSYNNPAVRGPLRLKVDTGAGGNTLPLRTYHQMFGNTPTNKILTPEPAAKLTSYSGHSIPCRGSIVLQLSKPSGQSQSHRFYVVDVPGPAILGLPSCNKLNILTLDPESTTFGVSNLEVDRLCTTRSMAPESFKLNNIEDVKWCFPECFDTIGKLHGDAKLNLKPDSTPYIDAPRRTPVHLLPKIKSQLNKMVTDGIIRKVEHHTDWCSSATYVSKKDGTIRICLDPQKLNLALKRCPHKIPTVDEINPQLSNAKYFSKLDAKAGYWSVKLAKDSTELTTFRTPFGRYCYLRMPFGLSVSQDIYQQHMDRIIDQCEGVRGISDDIIVYGATEEEHDQHLRHFLHVALKEGLRFNSSKCVIKVQQISFFGRLYTSHGLLPDPKKIEDIIQMPVPQDKHDLQRFLGMVNFIAPHLPNLSQLTAPLRDLLKKTNIWQWDADHQSIFEKTKQLVSTNICLQYYDPTADVQLEVDASIKGLGATLIQNKQPVAFASKSLTPAETNYSNIERECLAIVHGIQRFHHYLYGRSFTIISDHKPLEVILHKPLHRAPPRIQRMMTKIQGYNYTIKYLPGPQLVISDTLSRLPNPPTRVNVSIDDHVNEITINECTDISIDLLNFSPAKQSELRHSTSDEPVMRTLSDLIHTGWPEKISDIPKEVREFWSYRDELSMQNGIILKGNQVVIPAPLRPNILQQLHASHQGIEKTKKLARESVYWPGMPKSIENTCASCSLCQEMQHQQPSQQLQPHERPLSPWVKVGTDLFSIGNEHYLLISDYYSRYPIVKKLPSLNASATIKATKEAFSILGTPRQIMSDNGPQFQREYNQFCEDWNICHTTSSPRYPKSNGFIERQIQYIKPIIKKCLESSGDLHLAMMNVRATPLDSTLPSPAELMFGRKISTTLPNYQHIAVDDDIREHFNMDSEQQRSYHDRTAKSLAPLMINQPVRVFNSDTKLWSLGKIISKESDRAYKVISEGGRVLIRNRIHLRPVVLPEYTTPSAPQDTSTTPAISPSDHPETTSTQTVEPPKQSYTVSDRTDAPYRTRAGRIVNPPDRFSS